MKEHNYTTNLNKRENKTKKKSKFVSMMLTAKSHPIWNFFQKIDGGNRSSCNKLHSNYMPQWWNN